MEPEANNNLNGQCSDLEGYILDLGTRASDKFARTMKYLERYIGATYINSCQQAIITETLENFPDPDIPTTIPDSGIERPKIDSEMTYTEKKKID